MKTSFKKFALLTVVVCFLTLVIVAILLLKGILFLNNPSLEEYPVRGVDVSSYQGEINWEVLASQDIQFAFIKATEGSSHVDRNFQSNWEMAMETHLRVGAYHFFSYDSPGATQAENFISTVSPVADMLPPVVDVEFYGDKESNLPDKVTTQRELTVLLEALEDHYGMEPIIYATEKSYRLYIAGTFPGNPIWIRNVFWRPALSDNRNWTFWQFSDRFVLVGYEGAERFIDMNVFNGSPEEFAAF